MLALAMRYNLRVHFGKDLFTAAADENRVLGVSVELASGGVVVVEAYRSWERGI